eukprot:TRINITY_DN111852_c0_g1_i1.p1 TRINITY_DN111852_c0_g1~~TRINITY_DN111852_c0_g1_i1.p1  ORF type:complete len:191 (+),score=22.62 TRINITY_DN111852_c0_g1_i1:87-575(+)
MALTCLTATRHQRSNSRRSLVVPLLLMTASWSSRVFLPVPESAPRQPRDVQKRLLPAAVIATPGAAQAEINIDAYAQASGMSPEELRQVYIENTLSPEQQVLQALSDFFFDTVIPFLVGAGIVWGAALALGITKGPFGDRKERPSETYARERREKESGEKKS